MRSWIRWGITGLACLLGAAIVGYVALELAPKWFVSRTACRPGDKTFGQCLDAAKASADDRRAVTAATLALFAGAISVFGAYVTARSFAVNRDSARKSHELDRAGQITDRFTRAIDQLGSDKLDVRLGGIYALERIARDSAADHPQVVEVLTAFLREHATHGPQSALTRWPPIPDASKTLSAAIKAIRVLRGIAKRGDSNVVRPPDGSGVVTPSEAMMPATDVQAAITVLGRRNAAQDRPWARLDLRRVDLRGADLVEGDFGGATFVGADLRDAYLNDANLFEAYIYDVDLRGANLMGADLHSAATAGADFRGALYDVRTRWSGDFDPTAAGAVPIRFASPSVPPTD